MANQQRRSFLRGILAATAAVLAATTGLLSVRGARAAEWPRDAYAAKTVAEALANLYGTSATTPSPEIKVRAPLQADNGAVVPLTVSTDMPDVESISVLVEKNPHPLAAHLNLLPGAVPYFAVNIKMAESANVHFVVKSGGRLYSTTRNIKVTVGGCGA